MVVVGPDLDDLVVVCDDGGLAAVGALGALPRGLHLVPVLVVLIELVLSYVENWETVTGSGVHN